MSVLMLTRRVRRRLHGAESHDKSNPSLEITTGQNNQIRKRLDKMRHRSQQQEVSFFMLFDVMYARRMVVSDD